MRQYIFDILLQTTWYKNRCLFHSNIDNFIVNQFYCLKFLFFAPTFCIICKYSRSEFPFIIGEFRHHKVLKIVGGYIPNFYIRAYEFFLQLKKRALYYTDFTIHIIKENQAIVVNRPTAKEGEGQGGILTKSVLGSQATIKTILSHVRYLFIFYFFLLNTKIIYSA